MFVYVVHEIEGGSILGAWYDEQDAKSFLNWGEAKGEILAGRYSVKKVPLK